jgi:Zn ribbon nucleic-acid-binding protein
MNCNLHFIACSWYKNIGPAYCPECGTKDDNIHWIEETDLAICQIVPGGTPPPGFVKKASPQKIKLRQKIFAVFPFLQRKRRE